MARGEDGVIRLGGSPPNNLAAQSQRFHTVLLPTDVRLAAGETAIINGATGAYGTAAVLVALAIGAGKVVAAGRNATTLASLARAMENRISMVTLEGDVGKDIEALRAAAGDGDAVDLARSHNETRNIFMNTSPWTAPWSAPSSGLSEWFVPLPGTTSWGSMRSMMRQKHGRRLHLSSVGIFALRLR